jgi:serine carboxypeptidase-like clade 2
MRVSLAIGALLAGTAACVSASAPVSVTSRRVGVVSDSGGAAGSIPAHKTDITDLPGLPASLKGLKMRSGYIDVNPATGRKLFYWFILSQNNPATDPLVLWLLREVMVIRIMIMMHLVFFFFFFFFFFWHANSLNFQPIPTSNGGPGCSSIGGGLLTENGPFWASPDETLVENPHSWTKAANVVYLDSPANVGFSYSSAPSDNNVGDARTANDTYNFLQAFLDEHTSTELPLRTLPFWVTGESYGGHYVPNLAARIVRGNSLGTEPQINIAGLQVGNAWTVAALNNMGCVMDWRGHTVISDATADATLSSCDFAAIGPLMGGDQALCDKALNEVMAERGNINIYQIYEPLCDNRGDDGRPIETQGTRLMRELAASGSAFAKVADHMVRSTTAATAAASDAPVSPCVSNFMMKFLNDEAVQRAIHIDPLPFKYNMCSPSLNYSRHDLLTSVMPDYEYLYSESKISILVYSGDVDGIVSTSGDKLWIGEFTDKMGIKVKAPFRPWTADGLNVGGWRQIYDDGPKGARFTHSTVRGAGHMVPGTQPERSLFLFSKTLHGQPLIAGDEH